MTRLVTARHLVLAGAVVVTLAQAGSAAAADPRPMGIAITHQEVSCVVAAHHPVVEACFTPAAGVGRAHVLFRALESGPWYAVDMRPEGACHRAFLPKPRKETKAFRYFIEVIDRGFGATASPPAAPGESHGPRVVSRRAECGPGMMMAPLGADMARSLVVRIARDSAGRVLDASAAAKLEPGASLGGFSPEGVTMASTGARPSGAQTAVGAAGGGIGTLAVVAGGAALAAASVGVAVAAGGGGGQPMPAPVPSPPSGQSSLTGRWTGTAGNGTGLLIRITGSGVACTLGYDVNADLTQSGTSVTGPLTVVLQVVSCQPSEADPIARQYQGTVSSGAFNATISPPGGIGFSVGPLAFAGSFTANSIEVAATLPDSSFTIVYTLRLGRR